MSGQYFQKRRISLETWKFGLSLELVTQAGCQVCWSPMSACLLVCLFATHLDSQGTALPASHPSSRSPELVSCRVLGLCSLLFQKRQTELSLASIRQNEFCFLFKNCIDDQSHWEN